MLEGSVVLALVFETECESRVVREFVDDIIDVVTPVLSERLPTCVVRQSLHPLLRL
jgi:hypothetical protein